MTACSAQANRRRQFAMVAIGQVLALLLMGASCDPTTPPARQVLDWGLLDRDSNVTKELPSGSSFAVDWRHRYVLTLRSNDPDGVRHVAQWADGEFTCQSDQDETGTIWTAPRRLRVELPKAEADISPGLFYGFVMRPEFVPSRLSCGRYTFSGPGRPLEYFVTDGTLHVHGESTTPTGETTKAILDLVV